MLDLYGLRLITNESVKIANSEGWCGDRLPHTS